MNAVSLRCSVLGIACLLLCACGETPPGQGSGKSGDLGRAAATEAANNDIPGRIRDLEARVAALEHTVNRLSRFRGFPTGGASASDDHPTAAQAARQSAASPGGQPSGAVKQSAQPGQAVDFTNASEGQIFPQYGSRNMIVKTSAGLALTSASSEPVNLVFSGFSLEKRIEAIVSLRTGFWTDQQIRLFHDDRLVIAVTLSNYDLKFGDHVKKRSTTGWKRGEERNQLRIVIEDNNAWLYVNKRFFGVQAIESAQVNRLEISGIKRDQDFVYAVAVQPLT